MRPKLKEQLLRRISPSVDRTHKEQSKYGNATNSKNISSKNNSKSITSEVSNKATPLDTSTLPTRVETIDYNIVEYLKKMRDNISIYELINIVDQRELIVNPFHNLCQAKIFLPLKRCLVSHLVPSNTSLML